MGRLSDTHIIDWNTDATSNLPTDTTPIGRNLAGQFRNIKSVERGESLDKQFQQTGNTGTVTGTPPQIAINGNCLLNFPPMRKIRLSSVSSGAFIYGGVLSASYSGGNTTTTVVFTPLSGLPASGGSYFVDVGTAQPTMGSLPAFCQNGSLTITGPSTAGFVSYPRTEPDLAYFVMTTLISTNSTIAGASLVCQVDKALDSVTLTLAAAPGGTNSTVIGWTVIRTTY